MPVPESVSLSLSGSANNISSSELSLFSSSSFSSLLSCASPTIFSTTDSSGSFVVISSFPFFQFSRYFLVRLSQSLLRTIIPDRS